MPAVTALVAGNFTGQQRARASGVIAASAAVAVAAGPVVGGFVTANLSWRWVFAAEVLVAGAVLGGSAAVVDANAEARIEALQLRMFAVALVAALGLFLTTRLPDRPLVPASAGTVP